MLILSIGGQGDGKSMVNAQITYKAFKGTYDPILRRQNPRPYGIHSNCALYFCHPPNRTIDTSTGEMKVEASCKCIGAQHNGDLNPLSLLKKVRLDHNYLHWVTLFFTEFHRWADSHTQMQLPGHFRVSELLFEYLVDESRKRHFNLIMDSQARMKISNRIRDAVTYLILCINYAQDKDGLNPALQYIVIRDLLGVKQKWWTFRPGAAWVKFYGSLFNSWETPSRITQAELAWGSIADIPDDADSIIGTNEAKADASLRETKPESDDVERVAEVISK